MATRIGQQMGNYLLTRLLGYGGFANVYLGKHIHLDTLAAIKVLQRRLAGDHLQSFRSEAQALARLKHPHIVRILEFGVAEDKIPFLVMDFAPGGTLRQQHPRGIQVPLDTIMSYIKQVADALQYAHEQKQIHRDVKPENMLLGENEQVLLSDFGLVVVAQTSRSVAQSAKEMAGTVSYMAPEQFLGKPRFASDQYALGIVVYEWLSGELPFTGTFTEIASQHLYSPVPPLQMKKTQVTPALEEVVMKALAKEPQQRFPDMQSFAKAFEEALTPTFVKEQLKPVQPQSLEEQWSGPTYSTQPTNHLSQTRDKDALSIQPLQSASMIALPNHWTQDTSHTYPPVPQPSQSSEGQGQQREAPWMNLRWFILTTAILAPILFAIGFFIQIPIIITMSLVPAAICLILGLLQTAHYDQWYWFIGFLLLCPPTGMLYGTLDPDSKPNPPINLKQLILVLACLSYALLAVAIFINVLPSTSNVPTWWIYYICGGLWLSNWLLGFIYTARSIGAGSWIYYFFVPFTAPFAGLMAVFVTDTQPEKPRAVATKTTDQAAAKPKRKSSK